MTYIQHTTDWMHLLLLLLWSKRWPFTTKPLTTTITMSQFLASTRQLDFFIISKYQTFGCQWLDRQRHQLSNKPSVFASSRFVAETQRTDYLSSSRLAFPSELGVSEHVAADQKAIISETTAKQRPEKIQFNPLKGRGINRLDSAIQV